jgi:hypothetical protein
MGIKLGQLPKSSASDRPPAPKGNHLAICVRVLDMGTHHEEYKGKPKVNRKVRFGFELPDEKFVFNEENGEQPFMVDTTFNLSSFEGSNFYKAMESWTGEPPDESFDIEAMLGKPCMVNIVHTKPEKKGDKVYANIESITPVPKSILNAGVPKPENELVYWSVENGRDQIWKNFPDFLRKQADSCVEWNTESPDDAAANKDDQGGGPDDWN